MRHARWNGKFAEAKANQKMLLEKPKSKFGILSAMVCRLAGRSGPIRSIRSVYSGTAQLMSWLTVPATIGMWKMDFGLYVTIALDLIIIALVFECARRYFRKHGALLWSHVVFIILGFIFVSVYTYSRYFVTGSIYYENVIDNFGVLVGVGRTSNCAVAGWYKFTFCGSHTKSNRMIHRYMENSKYGFCGRFWTLESVMQVDSAGHPLAQEGTFAQMEIMYDYEARGLNVIYCGRGAMDPRGKKHVFRVDRFRDNGSEVNVFCDMTDGQNHELFELGSTSDAIDLQYGVSSSYTVRRENTNGRAVVIRPAFADFDGIVEKLYEYSDDDELGLPYVRTIGYDKWNRDGFRKTQTDYNGTNIVVREYRTTGCRQYDYVAASRNMDTWLRCVCSELDDYGVPTNILSTSCRIYDGLGRVTNEEFQIEHAMQTSENLQRKTLVNEYEWCQDGAVKSCQSRASDGSLVAFEWNGMKGMNAILSTAGIAEVSPCRIVFDYGDDWCELSMYDKTGTNVLRRVRVVDGRRMEFRSADGGDYEPRERNYGNEAVAFEWNEVLEDRVDVDGVMRTWECQYASWYDRNGELIICPAEWATRRTIRNPSYVRDPVDPRYAGRIRRVDFLDVFSNLCDSVHTPPSYAYEYDRNGRPTRIKVLDSNGKISTDFYDGFGMWSYQYDGAGRVVEILLESNLTGGESSTKVTFSYSGGSYIPSAALLKRAGMPEQDVTDMVQLEGLIPTFRIAK